MNRLRRFLLPVILLTLLIGVQPTLAHGYIVRAIPEDRSTLEHPPARLQYWFSEALEPRFSTITLRDQTGKALAEGQAAPDNPSLLTLQVPSDLPDGAYIVDLRPAFASDGHVVAESRVFFVGQEVGGVAGSTSGYDVIPLEVLWRTLLLASTMLAFGTAVVYRHVLVPAWGNPQYPAGWLPPRVMRRLNWIFGLALVALLGANILALLQQSMSFFSTGLQEVIGQGLWQVVRIGSRFGDVWTVRMVLLALAGGLFGLSVMWREERPDTVPSFWGVNVWVGALLVGTFSVTSHAAGSLMLVWLAMSLDWAHTLAVGVWVGGLAALTLVLPVALRPYSGEDRRQALLAVLKRFSWLAMFAVAVVVATGIYSALNWLYQPSDLAGTGWGVALIVKLALVAVLLLLGLVHHLAANPQRFQRWSARVERAVNLILTLRLETILALLTLVAVGNLSASAVPEPAFLTNNVSAPAETQTVGDQTVSVTISPGGPGVNTYDIAFDSGTPSDDLAIRMQIVDPARDWRSAWHDVPSAGPGLYVTTGDEINQDGRWWTLLDITGADGRTQRVAFDWDISGAAAVPTSITPGPLNLLAILIVVAALGFAAYPMSYKIYRWLDWRPVSVAIGASAIVATVVMIVMAVVLVQQSEADYEATINPPPKVVNNVLPDADSLALGAQLYAADCADWQTQTSDLRSLIERLPRTRDEALYFTVEDGWRGLPACTGFLTDTQRWHIVNYIRTMG